MLVSCSDTSERSPAKWLMSSSLSGWQIGSIYSAEVGGIEKGIRQKHSPIRLHLISPHVSTLYTWPRDFLPTLGWRESLVLMWKREETSYWAMTLQITLYFCCTPLASALWPQDLAGCMFCLYNILVCIFTTALRYWFDGIQANPLRRMN